MLEASEEVLGEDRGRKEEMEEENCPDCGKRRGPPGGRGAKGRSMSVRCVVSPAKGEHIRRFRELVLPHLVGV